MLAVALLTLGATVHGAVYSAFLVNCMDIAPQYAGTIFGISNMLGAATGFIAPPVAAALTPNVSDSDVTYMMSLIYWYILLLLHVCIVYVPVCCILLKCYESSFLLFSLGFYRVHDCTVHVHV